MGLGTKYKPATETDSGYKAKTILPQLKHRASVRKSIKLYLV